jgi:hypothetical protein
VTAGEWADRIAGCLVAGLPVRKAHGGTVRRDELAAMLLPACMPVAELEEGLARTAASLEALRRQTWRPDSPALPYPASRVEPMRAGEWDVSLTPAGGAR